MKITMIGHSTLLIESAEKRILTDPYFGDFGNIAYRRVNSPAMRREELVDVDIVLLSHGHFDHVDRQFFRMLPIETSVLMPAAMFAPYIRKGRNISRVKSWSPNTLAGIKITPVPAVHTAVTNGYVIESDGAVVYFAGDTYCRPFMKRVRQTFDIDVALMPVSTFRIPMTMGETEAVSAVEILKPKTVIPIHLGIQPRSALMRTKQSAEGFKQRLFESDPAVRVVILQPGETFNLAEDPGNARVPK